MRVLKILLLSIIVFNAVAATVGGVNFVDENTSVLAIRQRLFGTSSPGADAAPNGASVWDQGLGITQNLVVDEPQILGALVSFAHDSARIELDSYPVLEKFGSALQDTPEGVRVQITGHTDCLGNQRYNSGLALERAQAVQVFLIQNYGVAANLLQVDTKGEAAPLQGSVAVKDTDMACRMAQSDPERQWNRRVEFRVVR